MTPHLRAVAAPRLRRRPAAAALRRQAARRAPSSRCSSWRPRSSPGSSSARPQPHRRRHRRRPHLVRRRPHRRGHPGQPRHRPARGPPRRRRATGDDLGLAQYDGRLFVTNNTTGELMSVRPRQHPDRSGQRRVTPGGAADDADHGDDRLPRRPRHAARSRPSTPSAATSSARCGSRPRASPTPRSTAPGRLGRSTTNGVLHQLRWSDELEAFDVEDDPAASTTAAPARCWSPTTRASPSSAPTPASSYQVGTGARRDRQPTRRAWPASWPAPTPPPLDLVPASAPDDRHRRDRRRTATCARSTSRPSAAATRAGPRCSTARVYVPCLGDGKVIRLGADGHRAGRRHRRPRAAATPSW